MQTSCESIYAAGDVTEWTGQVVGLWANAIEQARVAAANAMGEPKIFAGFVPATILKCWEYPVFSIGEIVPIATGDRPGSDGITSKSSADRAKGIYRRVIYRHGMPVGGILVGTKEGTAELKKLVEWQLHIQSIERTLFPNHQEAA
jgi:nitrite reductase (NADH) large subunit